MTLSDKVELWKRKIAEDDCLRDEKENALDVAVYLRYSDVCLNAILKATSSIQISKALTTARQSA